MGETGQGLIFPTRENIIKLNRDHIQRTGGKHDGADNLLNENSLLWVLDAIQHPLFEQDAYPTISEKAAILGWTIIQGHVFTDGNKRTGMSTIMIFLRLNGFYISANDDEIIQVSKLVANARQENYTKEMFSEWVRKRLRLLIPPP